MDHYTTRSFRQKLQKAAKHVFQCCVLILRAELLPATDSRDEDSTAELRRRVRCQKNQILSTGHQLGTHCF